MIPDKGSEKMPPVSECLLLRNAIRELCCNGRAQSDLKIRKAIFSPHSLDARLGCARTMQQHSLGFSSCPELRTFRVTGLSTYTTPRNDGILRIVNLELDADALRAGFVGLAKLRDSGTLTDVTFEVDGQCIPAHRCVLAGQSRIFSSMFTTSFQESSAQSVRLPDTDVKGFVPVIDFLYGKPVVLRSDSIMAVLGEAMKWGIDPLARLCVTTLRDALDADNCWHVLGASLAHHLDDLKSAALAYIGANFREVTGQHAFREVHVDSLVALLQSDHLWLQHELTVFRAAVQWVLAQPVQCHQQLSELVLSNIRYARMDHPQLQSVMSHPLIRQSPSLSAMCHQLLRTKASAPPLWAGGPLPFLPPRRCTGTTCVRVLRSHTDSVTSVVFLEAQSLLLSASSDCTVKVWSTDTWQCVVTMTGHTDWVSAIAVVGSGLMSASDDRTLRVWDLTTYQGVKVIPCASDAVSSLVATAAGMIVSGGSELTVWDPSAGWRMVCQRYEHSEHIHTMVASEHLLFTGSVDRSIKVWDQKSWTCVRTLLGHGDWITALAVGERVLFSAADDASVRAWSLDTYECLSISKEQETVTAMAVIGGKLIIACNDDTIRIRDVATSRLEHVGTGHAEMINADFINDVAISNGRLAFACSDGLVKVMVPSQ